MNNRRDLGTVCIPTWCLSRNIAEVTHKSLKTTTSKTKSVKCEYHRCRRTVWKLALHSSKLDVLNKKEVYYPLAPFDRLILRVNRCVIHKNETRGNFANYCRNTCDIRR